MNREEGAGVKVVAAAALAELVEATDWYERHHSISGSSASPVYLEHRVTRDPAFPAPGFSGVGLSRHSLLRALHAAY